MDEAAVAQRTADPLARFLERGIGEADDREAGQARRDVDLDPDDSSLEPVKRCGMDGGQHRATLRTGAYLRLTRRFIATYFGGPGQ